MGTNYYIVKKDNKEKEDKLFNLLKQVDYDKMKSDIEDIIKLNYKKIFFDILKEEKKNEIIEDLFEEKISTIINNLQWEISDICRISDNNSIHIGKSSAGWLFLFQDQKEWHSYKEFKDYILNEDNMLDKYIVDEYNEIIKPLELIKLIESKQMDPINLSNGDNFSNCSNIDGYRFSYNDFS